MSALADELPDGLYKLKAFTRSFKVVVSAETATASISIGEGTPVMYVNPEFFAQTVDTMKEAAFIVFHELIHLVQGHDQRYLTRVFGISAESQAKKDKDFEHAMYAAEMEVKHLEHLILPPEYHTINEKLFAASPDEAYRIFWRDTDPATIADPTYRALHSRIFSPGQYSSREAFYLVRERDDDDDDDDDDASEHEDGAPGSSGAGAGDPGEPAEGDAGPPAPGTQESEEGDGEGEAQAPSPLIGSESKIEDGASRAVLDGIVSEIADAAKAAMGPAGGFTTGELLIAEAEHEVLDRPLHQPRIEHAVFKALEKPNWLGRVSAKIQREMGGGWQTSTIPNYVTDRRAQKDYMAGVYTPRYRVRREETEDLMHLYFDLSTSQDRYLPECFDLVVQLKDLFADGELHLFGSTLHTVAFETFFAHYQSRTVTSLVTFRGTVFDNVVRHALEHEVKRMVVITDNDGQISKTLSDALAEAGVYLLLIRTSRAPRLVNALKAWSPFATDEEFIDGALTTDF